MCKLKHVVYADDIILLYAYVDVTIIRRALEDIKSACKWFEANKLHQNVNKTKWSLLGTRQRLGLNDTQKNKNTKNCVYSATKSWTT